MDIDGHDFEALRTIDLRTVAHVNFEFSPTKFAGGKDTALSYLKHLRQHGFALYVFCCVDPASTRLERSGMRCLTQGNYRQPNGPRRVYVETNSAVVLSECVFALRDRASSVCTRAFAAQEIRDPGVLIEMLGNHEIDIVGYSHAST